MTFVAWFEIVSGIAILGVWGTLLGARTVPELAAGNLDIRFHITAELLTAVGLLGGGIGLLVGGGRGTRLGAALALGALLYTTINSAGYYAERRDWPPVAMFGLLAAVATVAAAILVGSG